MLQLVLMVSNLLMHIHPTRTNQANVHEIYVEYTLNPFAQVRAQKKISSRRFDLGMEDLVSNFNEDFGIALDVE